MNYVAHICRNPKCNNGWIDKDLTDARVNPPGSIVVSAAKS